MKSCLADFELIAPDGLQAVLALLGNGEGWRPIAGGTDLMVLFNFGTLPFRRLISLRKLEELRQIAVTQAAVTIGAAVTYTQIRSHPVLRSEFPLLCQAASWTGGIANQNQGTLGGNLVNASPAADSAPPLLVHDAKIHFISLTGVRSMPYAEFHLGYKILAMRPDELLYAIELPRRGPEWFYYGRKVGTRRAQAISKISFAGAARMEAGAITEARLAFGSIAPVPLRCVRAERAIVQGSDPRQALASEIAPITDMRSTAGYRSQVAQNLLNEFLERL
jgi:CO/xanthine dehydrogenase FAD-binding subunit